MLLTTHEDLFKHKGAKVTCEIDGTKIDDARIQVENGEVFICQNEKDGAEAVDRLGYKYSWTISDKEKYEVYCRYCTNITLIEEPKKSKLEISTGTGNPPVNKQRLICGMKNYKLIYKRSDGVEFTEGYIDGESIETLQERRKNHLSEANKITGKIREYNKLFK